MKLPLRRSLPSGDLRFFITDTYIIIMLLIFPLFTGFSGYANITFSKYLFFVSATGLWLVLLLLLSLKERRGAGPLSPGQWAALAFMAVCCLSFALSPWRSQSLIGRGRYDGLVTLLLYALILLGVSAFARPRGAHFAAFGLSVSLCCLVAVFQLFDVNLLGLFPRGLSYYDAGVLYSGTYLGTLGNTNILAAVLCLAAPAFFGLYTCGVKGGAWGLIPLFLSLLILAVSRSDSGMTALLACALLGAPVVLTDMARVRRALTAGAVSFAALALAFAFSPVRADGVFSWRLDFSALPLLLLGAAALCALLSPLTGLVKRPVSRRGLRLGFGLLSLFVLAAGLLTVYFRPGTEGALYELSRLLHGQWDNSFGSSRLRIWRACLELVPERPLLGGGPGTLPLRLNVEFSRYVAETGRTLRSSVDNAHNEYLSYLVNIGLSGLLAYLALLLCALNRWLRNLSDGFSAALGLGVCACCVQGFFGLGLCLSAPVLWVFLGLILSGASTTPLSPGGHHEE